MVLLLFITACIIIIGCVVLATYSIYKLYKDYPDDGGYN